MLVADIAEGRTVPSAGTFAALLDSWWTSMTAHRWEDATALRHRQDIDTHLVPALGRRRLADLEPADLDRLYARLTSRGLAPRTVQHVHNTARAALNHAVRQGLIARNPATAAVVPRRKRVTRALPTEDQLEAVIALAADGSPQWAAWFRVAFWTGARPAEVCSLRWADLDLDRAQIRYATAIGRAMLEDGRVGWREKGTKTHTERSDGVRVVAIDLGTVRILRRWRTELAARLLEVGELLDDRLYVFPADPYGRRPLTPATPSRRWNRYAKAADIPAGIRLYDAARHHHISWCLAMNFAVAEVAHRVGNSPETIFRTYAHLLTTGSRAIADAIDHRANVSAVMD